LLKGAAAITPASSFEALVRRLPVLNIVGGTTRRIAEYVVDRSRTPVYRAGGLLVMLTGDKTYADGSRAALQGLNTLMNLARSAGMPLPVSSDLYRSANSGDALAFEALALPVLQAAIRRADATRSVGPAYGGRLSGLGAVLAVM
jgi:hypothetical protein